MDYNTMEYYSAMKLNLRSQDNGNFWVMVMTGRNYWRSTLIIVLSAGYIGVFNLWSYQADIMFALRFYIAIKSTVKNIDVCVTYRQSSFLLLTRPLIFWPNFSVLTFCCMFITWTRVCFRKSSMLPRAFPIPGVSFFYLDWIILRINLVHHSDGLLSKDK